MKKILASLTLIIAVLTLTPQLVRADTEDTVHMVDLDFNAEYQLWTGGRLIARIDCTNLAIDKDTLLIAGLRFGSKKTWLEISGGVADFPSIGMSDGAVTARFQSEGWPIHFYGSLELLLPAGKSYWALRSDFNLISGKKNRLKLGIILEETKRNQHPFGIGPYTEIRLSSRYDELLFRFSYQWTSKEDFLRFATIFNFDFSWPRYDLIHTTVWWRRY